MRNLSVLATAAAVMITSQAGLATAQPAASNARPSQCFEAHDWQGWKAPDANTIYIKVLNHAVYRLDLASACPELLYPDVHLITRFRGPTMVCSAVDLDLQVSEGGGGRGFATPCIVGKITPLTPAEAAAIPKKFQP
jgi:hypothetical protein